MKARIFTLMMALLAFAWSAKADEITGMTLTISHNYGAFFEVSFPAEGWLDLDLTDESSTSIRIKRIEVQTSGTVSDVTFKATMYKTENGLQPDDGWRIFELPQEGNTWVLDFGDEAPDLIDDEMKPSPRTFRFFVQAKDAGGNDIFYNNGGEDYKVLFVKGGGSQSSDGIKSLKLTVRHNDGPAMTQSFPAEDCQEFVIEGQTTSLIIEKVEVETDESVSDVAFSGTMYSTSQGGPSDEWRSFPLVKQDNGHWVLDMGDGVELVESKWLTENKTKTFQFFVQAKDGNGSDIYYNNGGEDYKVTFSTGEGGDENWKIKFMDEGTAQLVLRIGDEMFDYSFGGDGHRYPSDQPGQLSSLAIEQFGVLFLCNEGVSTKDVSLQYKVYEEGHEYEGSWNRVNAQYYFNQGSNIMYCYADNLGIQVSEGLKEGVNYVLEVNYQVVVDGEYIFLGKESEGSKFRFSVTGGGEQTEGIRSFSLTVSCDGEVFTQSFPKEGWENVVIPGQTSSIKVLRVEVVTSESMTYAGFCSTIYDTADGWQHDNDAWDWAPLDNQGGGHWVLDYGEGRELIESDWLTESKTKTFEFFVGAGDSNGNEYQYANGINGDGYNNDYKVTFTTGEGGGDDQNWKVKFYKEGTASLGLVVNGEEQSYVFDGDGSRLPDNQPGDAYSLVINGFHVSFIFNDNINVKDVSLQYKVYEEGQEGGWNRIDAQQYYGEEVWNEEKQRMEHRMTCYSYDWREVAEGLEYGKNYVLEVAYQVVTSDGDYFFLARDKEGGRFRFYYDTETGLNQIVNGKWLNGKCYSLSGQRVGDSYKGIIINSGRKSLRK